MKKFITRNIDYAVKALIFLAWHRKETVSVAELVENLGIPRPFLRKILQTLNKNGLLKSSKGRGGGFVLALRPEKISLLDLIEIFQGSLRLSECFLGGITCPDRNVCVLKKKIDVIERLVISEFKSITIASLLEERRRKDD